MSGISGFKGRVVFIWGILGPCLLLGGAVFRVLPLALEPLLQQLMNPFQMSLYVGFVVFNAYAEGYRGFQRGYAPRVVARAAHLAQNPPLFHGLLAPLYTLGFIHSTRRRKIISGMVVLIVICAVVLVRHIPQPWRGIIDAGVAVGLVWGLLAVLALAVRAWNGDVPERALDLPHST